MMNKLLFFGSLFILFSASSCIVKNTDKIDFYLPKEFGGIVFVMYDCKNGIEPGLKNGRKQIAIPQNGIIKLKEGITFGDIDYKVFLEVSNGVFKSLKTYPSFQKNISDSVYVGPGTVVTASQFDIKLNKQFERYGYNFYVHRLNEIIPSNYTDIWMSDSLLTQIPNDSKH